MADDEHPDPGGLAELRDRAGPERWETIIAKAKRHVAVLAAVEAAVAAGASVAKAVRAHGGGMTRSGFLHLRRRVKDRSGDIVAKLADHRVPPPPTPLDPAIASAAAQLRRNKPTIDCDAARAALRLFFGAAGEVSDAWLRRVWAADREGRLPAGELRMAAPPKAKAAPAVVAEPADGIETVELTGGVALALLLAADVETGASLALAACIADAVKDAKDVPVDAAALVDDRANRGDHGVFTAEYNAHWRQGVAAGTTDDRWRSDADKAAVRNPARFRIGQVRETTLAAKLLAMGAAPLLTTQRGFDGLSGPAGAWLAALGHLPYMPATLDKCLAELGMLGVADAMWQTHAGLWHAVSVRWCGDKAGWLRTAVYVDGTADPYWTQQFAASGPVSRVGRVMPCISKVAVHSAAGVPLLVETHAGAVSLRKRLVPMLQKLAVAVGPQASLNRMTVVDSEAGSEATLRAMHEQTEVIFITVLKGQPLKAAVVLYPGPWQPYRERDQVREVTLLLYPRGEVAGNLWRGVQLQRQGGRVERQTQFITTAVAEELDAAGVADQYMQRWPEQEQQFREGRQDGLHHSFGYGGGNIQHVALVPKQQKATAAVARARTALAKAETLEATVQQASETETSRATAVALAAKQTKAAKATLVKKVAQQAKLQSMPSTIWQRDLHRDSVMTCLKLMMLTLAEYVLREYFGQPGMQWRGFVESLTALPVTMTTTRTTRTYTLGTNPRQPQLTPVLVKAAAEITLRKLSHSGRQLIFQVAEVARVAPNAGSA